MEAARPVHHIVIEPMQAVAGDNKEFFPLRCAVKQAQKCGLWIGIMIATKGFVKLVKQEYNLLFNGLNVRRNARESLIDNDNWVSRLHSFGRQEACEE